MTPDQLAKSGSEHSQQRALFAWANMAEQFGLKASLDERSYTTAYFAKELGEYNQDQITELKWLHAIHNQGHGDKIRGAIAKAEGVKTGIWDIFLPVVGSRKPEYVPTPLVYAGLYIEMKVGKNNLTTEQVEFRNFAQDQGYKCVVCYSWRAARDEILKYLGVL